MAQEEVILKLSADVGNLRKELEEVKKGIDGIGDATKKTEKNTGILAKGIKKVGASFGSILKASGIVIVLQKAFEFFSEALMRNQKIADAIAIAFDTVSIVFNEIVNVLVGVYENVAKSSENFDALGKVLGGMITIVLTPFKLSFFGIKLAIEQTILAFAKLTGDDEKIIEFTARVNDTKQALEDTAIGAVDAGKSIVSNFSEAVGEATNITKQVVSGIKDISITNAIEQAKTNKELEKTAQLAQAELQGLVEENDRLAEQQRQIRDNENATFEDRIKANNKLKEILDTQKKDMLALADIRIAEAQAQLDTLNNTENQVALQEALNEKKGIEAQITGFMSEQMTNQISLENERRDTVIAIGLEMQTEREREIAEIHAHFDEQFRLAKKAGMDTVGLEKQKNKALRDLRIQQQQQDLEQTASTLNAISGLFGEQTGAFKAIKVVETTISTYTSAQKAYESALEIPVIGTFLAPIAMAGAIATGLRNLSAITNTPTPSFAQGGMVGGYGSGTSDSVNARLSKGETVINAKSTRMFKPILSQINQAGGGVGFADGGTLDTGSGGMTTGVVKAFVVADDMTDEQQRLSNIRRKATI